MNTDDHTEDRERGSAAGRVLLSVALALTVSAIAVGTWVLGSGGDPVQQERATTLVSDVSAPQHAQPPLSVAPPPAADATDATG